MTRQEINAMLATPKINFRFCRWAPAGICLALFLAVEQCAVADSSVDMKDGDWTHWRGPLQTGYSPEKNLPDDWDPRTPGKNNLIWKQPYGCRSAPMIMNGR